MPRELPVTPVAAPHIPVSSRPDVLELALRRELAQWEAAGLRRELRANPVGADFTSNDTLGLARHPAVVSAAREALARHGAGGRASRLLGGGSPLEAELEKRAATWLGCEACLLFPTGYQANLGLIGALAGPGDALFCDERNHASLVDAARLSRAAVFVHRHLDTEELARQLGRARGARRRVVVTEALFSMDGDAAPLAELDLLCARHDAWLVVDEAHAAGILGPEGAGAWAALGAAEGADGERLAARVVTGGKALGVAGALVAGSAALRELLVHRARAFVYTTAPSPAVTGGLLAALEVCRAADGERARVAQAAHRVARALGLGEPPGAIVPFVVGGERAALALEAHLSERGLVVRAVRPPTVPAGSARLRIVCHAFNTDSELARLGKELAPHAAPAKSGAPAFRAAPRLAPVVFVAGTDTGVGKTVVAAVLTRAARGRYWKPVQTGPESDSETVAGLADVAPGRVHAPAHRFAKPASPHEAAAAEGLAIDPDALSARLRELRREHPDEVLVVELAGGLLVPLHERFTQLDWLARERPPVVLAARSGLGTLNHTLLSLEALRARHLEPRALFLVGPPHAANRATLGKLAGVPALWELPTLDPLGPDTLQQWLDEPGREELANLAGAR